MQQYYNVKELCGFTPSPDHSVNNTGLIMSASMIPGKKITATDIIERMDYRGKKYIILSFVFTVLGVIVGLFFLMIMPGIIFDVHLPMEIL